MACIFYYYNIILILRVYSNELIVVYLLRLIYAAIIKQHFLCGVFSTFASYYSHSHYLLNFRPTVM